jgi:hypothetical protein
VRDTRRQLEAMGYRLSRQASPGHFAVETAGYARLVSAPGESAPAQRRA